MLVKRQFIYLVTIIYYDKTKKASVSYNDADHLRVIAPVNLTHHIQTYTTPPEVRGTDINVKIQLFRGPLFHILFDLCFFYLNFYRSCKFSSNIEKLFVSIGQILNFLILSQI